MAYSIVAAHVVHSAAWHSAALLGFWLIGNPADLSMGIGTATVPEPASLAELGVGVLAMIKRRRK